MKTQTFGRIVSLLVVIPMALTAQVATVRDEVPLKNWPTPLYWHPTHAEREAVAAASPKLQFPVALSTDALTFVAMTPCRVADTRFLGNDPFPSPPSPLSPGTPHTLAGSWIQDPTKCGVPSFAQAYSLNVTIQPSPFPSTVSFLSVSPTPMPLC